MRRRPLIAIAVGVVVLWLTQWGHPKVMELLLVSPATDQSFLTAAAVDVLLAVASLLPGFCTGAIAGRHGILLGTLTGLIGSATYSVLFILFRLHFSHLSNFFTVIGAPMWFWIVGPGLVINCAAGGAVGELLRSNNRIERPRDK
jgi:hypothetical protein